MQSCIYFSQGQYRSRRKKTRLEENRELFGEMVKRCAWGTCNADERYPEKLNGAYFIPFPKPKTQKALCLQWIKACGRPYDQLNVNKIDRHKYVCSRHFIGGNGPTKTCKIPVPADGSQHTPSRPSPKRRSVFKKLFPKDENSIPHNESGMEDGQNTTLEDSPGISSQTEIPWVSSLDLLVITAENERLQAENQKKDLEISKLRHELQNKEQHIQTLEKELTVKSSFSVASLLKRTPIPGIFQYYTGITYVRFLAMLTFLVPSGFSVTYESGRNDITRLQTEDCLFLVLCRLRHNFGLKDIAVRFGISLQSCSVVFNTWIKHMYLKFGQLSIWPHREKIINNMPRDFKSEFPNTLIIVDGTEIKTQVPSALAVQSQMYSDYKSNTTLKCLIGCDPSGSVIFVSELFTGSISDKAICEQCGFFALLKKLKQDGYVKDGDAVMADKGFTIEQELQELGLKLNIPPFASSACQMSPANIELTQKIAKHRIHIERLIAKVKTFKIVSQTVPTTLFTMINQIWSVCCFLTLFQDIFVKDKN